MKIGDSAFPDVPCQHKPYNRFLKNKDHFMPFID